MEKGLVDVLTSLHISAQKLAPDAIEDNMKAIIQSFPPLGQITQVDKGQIALTAVLEVPSARQTESWQVAVWQSVDGGEWHEAILEVLPLEQCPHAVQASGQEAHLFYSTSLDIKESLRFTLRFRHGEHEPWRWTRDELGLGDGHMIVSNASATSALSDFGSVIHNLDPAWEVKSLMSQAPKTRLWSLTAEVPASTDDHSSLKNISLGVPWGGHHIRSGPLLLAVRSIF